MKDTKRLTLVLVSRSSCPWGRREENSAATQAGTNVGFIGDPKFFYLSQYTAGQQWAPYACMLARPFTWLAYPKSRSVLRHYATRQLRTPATYARNLPPTNIASNHQLSSLKLWWNSLSARKEAHRRVDTLPILSRDLVLFLIRLIDSYPRIPFSHIAQQHDEYRHIQTADSYNVLLELACRSPGSNNFQRTYEAMQRRGFSPDQTTRRLYVRHLVKEGEMEVACAEVFPVDRRDDSEPARRDLVWELIQVPDQNPRQRLTAEHKAHKLPSLEPLPTPLISLADLKSTMSSNVASSPFVESCIAYLIYLNRYSDAVALAQTFVGLLPPPPEPLPSKVQGATLRVLHKLLELPPATLSKRPHSSTPFTPDSALNLLEMHPGICATATTLALALEWLRSSRHRGRDAYRLLREWRVKYGEQVEDSRIRLKIARFALAERNIVLARKMINRELKARKLGDSASVGREWEKPRNDKLWADLLRKYAAMKPRRGWTPDEGVLPSAGASGP